jgi:predicted ATPase
VEDRAGEIFVGRAHELGVLERALAAAQAGAGATALVAGEAGIGKTRLATELGRSARTAGFEVLLGRSIDLIGTELPYQPIVDALRPLGELERTAGSQLRAFEQALTLVSERAVDAPVLLVLEDLHWADTSTLDLVVFLAHNIDHRRILLLVTYRTDEMSSAVRMSRLAQGVRRSGAAMALELGPLEHRELTQLLLARAATPLAVVVTDAIVARSEGNPFFAEELLFAAADCGQLPHGVRDLMLQRVARLDRPAQSLLRVAAAAGREVAYALLQAVARQPDADLREGLRQAVEHGVLVADHMSGSFRFRHALLAEAIYGTILPGEREELHARLAEELTRSAAAAPAELSRHWAAAGRRPEAMVASI